MVCTGNPQFAVKIAIAQRRGQTPFSSLFPTRRVQVKITQTGPPETWRITLVCSRCNRQGDYVRANVGWLRRETPLEDDTRLAFWKVELQCAHEYCESRRTFHTLVDSSATWEKVLAVVRTAEPPIVCDARHSLAGPRTVVLFLQQVYSV